MSDNLITAIGDSLRQLSSRQRVIAQNIANADTPGYKARELAPQSFAGLVDDGVGAMRVAAPTVDLSDRMKGLGARNRLSSGTIIATDVSEVKPDGNSVTLEDELLKMGQVQADYAALTSLYRKQMGLIKTALGKGGSA